MGDGLERVWRKLYARKKNVCTLVVLGFDLCIMKYHVKCNVTESSCPPTRTSSAWRRISSSAGHMYAGISVAHMDHAALP